MFGAKKPVNTDQKAVDEVLNRGAIVEVLPSKEQFRNALLSGKRLKLYIGFDPTSTALHLSHAKNFMALEDFRRLGHEVIVLFGDFTAQIGDPSERATSRKVLSPAQIKENMQSWKRQIEPILNFSDKKNPATIQYNSAWLGELTFAEILNLASNFTVQQMVERDMFATRIAAGEPVHLHEFLYPLMQGYDSVALEVDAEMGGTDQTFNMLAGRTLLRRLKNKEKFLIVVHLLANPKTGELMSKSRGTGVFLGGTPEEMYGQIMAEPDEMIRPLFVNCTRLPFSEIDRVLAENNPKTAKMFLAKTIVGIFHGAEAAAKAEIQFTEVFSHGGVPDKIETIEAKKGSPIAELIIAKGLVASKTEWRRLLDAGAIIEVENGKMLAESALERPLTLKIGKRRFVRIVPR